MTKAELVSIVNNICSSLKLDENYTISQKCSMLIGTNVDLDQAEDNGRLDYIHGLVMESKFGRLYNGAELVIEDEEPDTEPEVIDDEDGANSEARVEELLDDEESLDDEE